MGYRNSLLPFHIDTEGDHLASLQFPTQCKRRHPFQLFSRFSALGGPSTCGHLGFRFLVLVPHPPGLELFKRIDLAISLHSDENLFPKIGRFPGLGVPGASWRSTGTHSELRARELSLRAGTELASPLSSSSANPLIS